MALSDIVLMAQGLLLAGVGIGLHYSPQMIIPYFHNDPSRFTQETWSVLKGWGTTFLGLAAIVLQMKSISSPAARRCTFRGMMIVWGLLAYGQWKMILKASAPWNNTTQVLLFGSETFMMLLNLYLGVIDSSGKEHDE